MTGLEHYQEAQDLLAAIDWNQQSVLEIQVQTAAAHVHATLALAAATALGTAGVAADGSTASAWRRAIVEQVAR